MKAKSGSALCRQKEISDMNEAKKKEGGKEIVWREEPEWNGEWRLCGGRNGEYKNKNKNKNKNIYLSSNRHTAIFLRQRRQWYNNLSVVDKTYACTFYSKYIRIIHHVGRLFAHRG